MKQVEVVDLIKIIWRWIWLIVILVAAVVGLLYWQARNAESEYEAQVTLFVSTPDREGVAAIDEYAYTDSRDLITTAINSFVQVAQYDEVKRRTQSALGIAEDYTVRAEAELGADFVYITVRASQPELAQQIADAHAATAIQYFGELRSLPSTQALTFFSAQLETARQALADAQQALANFNAEHEIISLDTEISIAENVLEQLELAYAALILPSTGTTSPIVLSQADLVTARDAIAAQRLHLSELSQLKPEYDLLVDEVNSAQSVYDGLVSSVEETKLRQSFASQAMFVQVVKPAEVPESAVNSMLRTLALGGAASLGLSMLLVFFLDYLRRTW